MAVNFTSSRPAFRADNVSTPKAESSVTNNSSNIPEQKPDVVCTQNEQPAKKKGFFTRVKDGFINMRKVAISTGHMVYGTVKGALFGSVAGGAVLAVDAVRNLSKKSALTKEIMAGLAKAESKEAVAALQNMAKQMPKRFSTKGMIFAGLAAAGVVAYNLVQAKLNANEAGAKLDHRWNTGHKEQG